MEIFEFSGTCIAASLSKAEFRVGVDDIPAWMAMVYAAVFYGECAVTAGQQRYIGKVVSMSLDNASQYKVMQQDVLDFPQFATVILDDIHNVTRVRIEASE